MMMKIVHIINPVKVDVGNKSYLHVAQPVTFTSMLKSKEIVEKDGFVQVQLCTTQYEEDREIIPEGFTILPNLTRSCQDVFNFTDKSRKLPLIVDILRRVYDHTDGEWIVYTNADICLSEKFYSEVVKRLKNGVDAMCIHRVDIPKVIPRVGRLDETKMEYIYTCRTDSHFGHDCFVFSRSIIPKLGLGHTFIGYPPIGCRLRDEIKKYSKKFVELDSKERLTMHIGKDMAWKVGGLKNEYYDNNMQAHQVRQPR